MSTRKSRKATAAKVKMNEFVKKQRMTELRLKVKEAVKEKL